jgi:hypothetical protein
VTVVGFVTVRIAAPAPDSTSTAPALAPSATSTGSLAPLAAAQVLAAAGASGCDGSLEPPQKPRTVRIVESPAVMVGRNLTTCSHGPAGGSPERWCAFARPLAEGRTELWVIDVRRAMGGEVGGNVRCDGTSPHCLRLTSELWTGMPLFSPAHPTIHAFHGDTLIFYARSATGNGDQDYEGAIQAWRPGAGPRTLTSAHGRACLGHERSGGLICIDNARRVSREDEFDLLAGSFAADREQPLPIIEAIRPVDADGDLLWQVGFSPDGSHLAFSDRIPEGGKKERLRIAATEQLGRTPPRELVRDAAIWQFSPDGKQIFFLRGYNYGAEGRPAGTLAVADFPSGANLRELQPGVGRFQVHGEAGGPTRAIGLYQEVSGFAGRYSVLADLARPTLLAAIGSGVEDALVSPDLRYSLLWAGDDNGDLVTFVARNDGSGRCQVAAHPGRGVYAPTFLSSPPVLIWAEDAADNPLLTEGWLGDPQSCEPRQQFSSRLALYEPMRTGVVWGDLEDGARVLTLRYAPFAGAGLALEETQELRATIDGRVTVMDDRYVLFSVSRGTPEETGLYVHGPL